MDELQTNHMILQKESNRYCIVFLSCELSDHFDFDRKLTLYLADPLFPPPQRVRAPASGLCASGTILLGSAVGPCRAEADAEGFLLRRGELGCRDSD